jgi:integrase
MLLTDIVVKNQSKAGRFTDDQTKGLHLWVKKNGRKYWIWRFTASGKRHGMSLGSYPEVSLRQARERAIEARNSLNKGLNPLRLRKDAKVELKAPQEPVKFHSFALNHIESMRSKWRNEKHADQWVSTLRTHAFPLIGDLAVDEIDTPHILRVLEPIWHLVPETASRLRGRLERILSAAITLKLRPQLNPAVWRGHLETLLPPPKKSGRHHEALPYKALPEFMKILNELSSTSALALEFAILTATRTGEVLGAKRCEINTDVWCVPALRMKAKRDHQVPLCKRALEIVTIARSLDPESDYLFSNNGKPLSNMAMLMLLKRFFPTMTVHGFRSSFRDWVSEETDHSPEVAEMALAHTIGNKVEAAYRRGALLERRRRLMEDWENFCSNSLEKNLLKLHLPQAA